jgi:hypothetical protein
MGPTLLCLNNSLVLLIFKTIQEIGLAFMEIYPLAYIFLLFYNFISLLFKKQNDFMIIFNFFLILFLLFRIRVLQIF